MINSGNLAVCKSISSASMIGRGFYLCFCSFTLLASAFSFCFTFSSVFGVSARGSASCLVETALISGDWSDIFAKCASWPSVWRADRDIKRANWSSDCLPCHRSWMFSEKCCLQRKHASCFELHIGDACLTSRNPETSWNPGQQWICQIIGRLTSFRSRSIFVRRIVKRLGASRKAYAWPFTLAEKALHIRIQ